MKSLQRVLRADPTALKQRAVVISTVSLLLYPGGKPGTVILTL